MAEILEGTRLGDVLKGEREGRQSRETVTILAGDGAARALVLGQVCGRVSKGAATIVADEDNTGAGLPGAVTLGAQAQVGAYRLVCTQAGGSVAGDPTVVAGANTGDGGMANATAGEHVQLGAYTVTCITEVAGAAVFSVIAPNGERLADAVEAVAYDNGHLAFTIGDCDAAEFAAGDSFTVTVPADPANSGTWQVAAPDGKLLPPLTVGTAYAGGHINLTLADGDPDFVVGDGFMVTVAAGSGKVKELDPAAVDGSQVASDVMLGSYTAQDGVDAVGVSVVRDAVVAPSGLVWPDAITDGQKATALAQLKAQGIITRTEV